MPTENRRVATYLPKEIDDRFKAFIADRNLKGDSQALIVILSDFLGVSQKTAQVAQSVDYSLFATQEQFNELSAKVSEVSDAVQKSSTPGAILSKLLGKVEQIERRLESLEAGIDKNSTLSTGDLAKRLNMAPSTLSHWKGKDPRKSKSPDELLKATRDKDPDGIGWMVAGNGKFKPECELQTDSPEAYQSELPISS